MRGNAIGFLFLASVLAACAAPAPDSLVASAQPIVETGVALTLQAAPTNTPRSTDMSTATPTVTPTLQPTSEASPTATVSASPEAQGGVYPTPADLGTKDDGLSRLLLQNDSGQTIYLILDGPTHLEYRFSDSFVVLVEQGPYHYTAWIGENGPYEGDFRITDEDKRSLVFSSNKITIKGP